MYADPGIATLIDLHGQVIDQGQGYWLKIEAWRIEPTTEIPHGIRYSLTLHAPHGKRILGYDNAHTIKPPKRSSSMPGASLLMTTSTATVRKQGCRTHSRMPTNC